MVMSKISGQSLYIQHVGEMRVRWHRPLPDNATLKQVTILRKPSGWYALFTVELPIEVPEPTARRAIGIDVGLHHALALSNGTLVDSPRFLREAQAKKRRLQRSLDRKKRGSKNRAKARHLLAKHEEHIANQRRDWWHKVTAELIATYDVIAIEDLNLKFMTRNHKQSYAAHDVALGIFYDLLDYKAESAGVEVVRVNPAYTSQDCSGCGHRVPKLLSERVHRCPKCGLTLDRDVNAALNILSAGTRRPDANVGHEAVRSLGSFPF